MFAGVSGLCVRTPSIHRCYHSGHATALSRQCELEHRTSALASVARALDHWRKHWLVCRSLLGRKETLVRARVLRLIGVHIAARRTRFCGSLNQSADRCAGVDASRGSRIHSVRALLATLAARAQARAVSLNRTVQGRDCCRTLAVGGTMGQVYRRVQFIEGTGSALLALFARFGCLNAGEACIPNAG
jgi:hypothetical protein